MVVIIRKRHTKDTRYNNLNDDALARAVREQTEINVHKVYGDYLEDQKSNHYEFDTTGTGYNSQTFDALQKGFINEIKLELNPVK